MDFFEYRDGRLYCEDVAVDEVAAAVGTPLFVYSISTAEHHMKQVQEAFAEVSPVVCYSMKANSNRALVRAMARMGAGIDIVSGGELFRLKRAGVATDKVVFAGVGKTEEEIAFALAENILAFNVESVPELEAISAVAGRLGKQAPVALRINPDVDPHTHTFTTTGTAENKFGIAREDALDVARRAAEDPALRFIGFHVHIGSQQTEVEPYRMAVERMVELVEKARAAGIEVEYLNLGGGFGIDYKPGEAPPVKDFADAVVPLLKKSGVKVILEPGRFIVGNAGVLVARVLYVKHNRDKTFLITDAGMNDLVRPAFYGAYHRIEPLLKKEGAPTRKVDVVGPVCESSDFFAKDRELPEVAAGELLAIFSAGAYCMVMSSNFNSRRRAPEVVVKGARWCVSRRRENYEDLVACESNECDDMF